VRLVLHAILGVLNFRIFRKNQNPGIDCCSVLECVSFVCSVDSEIREQNISKYEKLSTYQGILEAREARKNCIYFKVQGEKIHLAILSTELASSTSNHILCFLVNFTFVSPLFRIPLNGWRKLFI